MSFTKKDPPISEILGWVQLKDLFVWSFYAYISMHNFFRPKKLRPAKIQNFSFTSEKLLLSRTTITNLGFLGSIENKNRWNSSS